MRNFFQSARLLAWVTQFGFSVAAPLAGCILLAVWLRGRFVLGGWVVALGVVLGILGAVGGLVSSVRLMDRQGAAAQKQGGSPGGKGQTVYFNEH